MARRSDKCIVVKLEDLPKIYLPPEEKQKSQCPIRRSNNTEPRLQNVPLEDKRYTGPATSFSCNHCNAIWIIAVTTGEILSKKRGGDY